ncbi:hypothetical protein Bbelb_420220 [Branchiostoma belcheri]|nr:hypothetical protein Bbelb_420220 [Branchiostoma belcheri]
MDTTGNTQAEPMACEVVLWEPTHSKCIFVRQRTTFGNIKILKKEVGLSPFGRKKDEQYNGIYRLMFDIGYLRRFRLDVCGIRTKIGRIHFSITEYCGQTLLAWGRQPETRGASAKRIKSGRRRHLQLWRARPTISPVASDDVTRAGHLRTGRSPGFGELEAQRPKFLRLADACASAKRIKSGRRRHLQLWRARPTISPVASDDVTRAGHLRTGRSPGFGELEAQRPKFLRLADACASAKRIKSGRRRHLQLWRARPTISPVASDDVTRAGHLRTGRSPGASAKRIKSGRRRHLQLWRARPTISPVASDDVTRAGHLRTGRSPGFGELEAQRPKFLRLADACASAKRIKSGRRRHLQLWRARPTISPVASDDVTRAGHLRTGRSPGFGELEAQRPKFLRLADACASAKRIKSGRRRHLQLWRARPTISPVASDDVTRAGHLRTGRSPGFGELEAQRPKFLRLADACASAKRIKSGRRRHLQLWRARPTISPVASDDVTRAGHLRTGRSPGFGELEAQRPKFLRLADACASAKRIKSGRRRHLQLWRARPTISPVASDDVTRAGHLRTGRSPGFGECVGQAHKVGPPAPPAAVAARPTISPVASDDVTRAGHLRTGRSPGFGELEAQRPKFLRLADACASAKRIKSGRRRHLQLWRARPTISPVASDDVTRAGHLRTGRSPGFGELEAQRPKFLRLADACASAKRIKSGRRRHLQLWRARPTISPVASDDVTRAGHLRTGRSPGFGELEAQRPKFLRLADACASAKRIKSGRRRHLQLWRARPTISPVASDDVTRAGHLRTGRSPGFGELEAQRPKFLRLADACASAKRIKSGRRRHLQLWRARPTISPPVASDDVTRAGHLRTGRSPGFGELEAQRPKFLRLADACASAKRIKSGRRRHLQLWRARPTISPVASDDVTRAGHLRTGRSPGFGELEAQRPKFLRLADACASAKRIKSGRRRHLQLWRARPTISPVASDDVTRAGHLRTGRSLVSASASAKRIKSGRRRHLQLWRARPTISPVASDDVTRAGHLRTGRSPGASAKRIKSGRRRHLQLWRARPTISPVASDDVTRAGHLRTGRSPGASAKRIKSGRRRHLQLWRARPTISPVASDDVTRAGHLRTGRSPGFGELEAQRPKFLRLADACASAKRIKSGRRRHLQLWRARPTISPVASDDVTRAGHLRTGRSPGFGECVGQAHKVGPPAPPAAVAGRPTISPVASDDVTRAGHLRTGRSPGFGELEAQRPKFLRLADACASAKRIKSGRRRHLQLWRARPTISPVASDDVTRAGHLRTGRSPWFRRVGSAAAQIFALSRRIEEIKSDEPIGLGYTSRPGASAKRIKSGRRRHLQLWRARPTISPVASDDVTRAGHLRTGRSPWFRASASAKRIKSGRRRHLQLWRARPTISPVASDDVTRAGHLRTGRSPGFGELEAQRPKFLRLADACASAKRIKSGRRRHLQLWRARPTISPVASDDVTRAGHLRTGRSPWFRRVGSAAAQIFALSRRIEEIKSDKPIGLGYTSRPGASAKRIKSGRRRHLQLWRARPTISPVASDDVTRAGHLRTGRSPGFGELEAQRPKFLRLADACASAKRIKSGRRRHLQLWRARPTISPVASDDVTRAGHLRTGRSPGFGELEAQRPKFLRLADACRRKIPVGRITAGHEVICARASAKRIKSGRRRHLQLWRARPTISPVASDDVTRAGHLRTGRSPGFGECVGQAHKVGPPAPPAAVAGPTNISPVASDDVTRAGHLRTGRSPGFGELEAQRPKFLRLADACASAKRIKSGRRRHLQLWRARPTISPVASDDVTRAGHLRTGRSPGFGELEAQRPKFLRLADACASAKRIKSGRRRHLQLWRARPTISPPVASDDVTRAGHLRTGRSPVSASASAKRIKSGRRRHLQLWRARPTISPVASDDVTRAGHLRTGRSPGASAKRIKSGRRRHLQLWRARPTISPVASDDVTRAGHLRTGRSPVSASASAKRIKSGRRRHLQLWRARPTISPVASDDVTRAGHLRTGRSPGFGELEAQRPKFLRLADACASAKRIKSGRRRHLQLWRARPTISPVASDDVTRAGHLRTGRSPDFGELEAQRPKFLRLADACASAKRIKSGRRRHLQLWRARPTISPVASDDVTRAGHLRTGRSPGFGELEAQRPKFLRLADACASAKRIKSGRRRHLQLWRARPTISPVASDDVTRAGHLRTGRSPGFGELEAQRPKFLRLADACASAKRIKSGRRRHLQLWRARPTISPVASDDVTRAGHLRTGRSPGFGELEAQRPKFLRLADACASAKRIKSGRRRHLQLWRARPTISPVASDDVTRAGHLRTGRSPGFGELEAQRPKFLRLADACASAKRIKSGRRRHLQLWRARPTISPVASDDVTRAGHLRTGRSPDFGELEAQRPKFLRLADACASAKRIKSGRRRHLQLWRARPTISPVASDDVTRAGHLRTGRSPGFGELEAQRPKFLRLADACASAKRIKSGRRRHLQLWRARPTISPVASDDVTRAGHLRTGRSLVSASASAKRIKSGRRRHLQLWRARPTISHLLLVMTSPGPDLRTGRSPDFGELEAQRPKFLRLADACASAKRIKSGRRRHLQLWRARPTISPVASDDVTRAGHLRTGRSPGFGELEAQRPKFLRLADACASAKRIKSGRRRHLQLWRPDQQSHLLLVMTSPGPDISGRDGPPFRRECVGQAHKVGPPAPPAAVAGPTNISPVASDDVTRAGHLRTGRSPGFGELEAQRPKFLRLADACASAKRIKSGRRRHLQLDDVTRAGHLRTGRSPGFGELEAQRPKFLRLADACRRKIPVSSAKRIKSGRRRHLQLWRARPTISPVASDDVTRAGHLRTGRSPDFGELEAQRPKFLRLADACASAKRIKSGRRRHLQLWRARPTISPVASDDVTRAGHLRTGRCVGQAHKVGPPRHLQLWRARPTISPVASDDVTRAGHLRTGRSPDFGELEAQRPKFLRLADACASAKRIKSGRRRHLQLWRARPTISPVASDDVTRAGHLRTGRSPDFGELEAQRPKFLRLADACASAKRIKSGRRRHLQLWRARPTSHLLLVMTSPGPDISGRDGASAKRIKSGRRRHLQLWRARPTISPVASDDVTRAGHLRTGRSPISASASAKRIKSGRRRHLQLWRARPTISPVASDDVTRAGHLRTGRCVGQAHKVGPPRHLQLWRARPTISPVASDDVTRAGHLRTGRSPGFGELEAQRPKFLRLADACRRKIPVGRITAGP